MSAARKYKVGDRFSSPRFSFEILERRSSGVMAMSYEGSMNGSQRVFIKKYKMPKQDNLWYREYVRYQDKMKAVIEEHNLQRYTLPMLDCFEIPFPGSTSTKKCYHQVFPLIKNGKDLKAALLENPDWETRKLWALIFVSILDSLHQAGIIHCDLKPENILLIPKPESKFKYKLILIDLDYSILQDQEAPWHGHKGYVGTPGYMSPEHHKGLVPQKASDIYTAGIILYELLCGRPPPEDRANLAQVPINLLGSFRNEYTQDIRTILPKMLHQNPSKRPLLSTLRTLFKEQYFDPTEPYLKLVSSHGHTFYVHQDTIFNQDWISSFIPDEGRYWNAHWQFFIHKSKHKWVLLINPQNVNPVMLNNSPAKNMIELKGGDRLCLQSKNTTKQTVLWTISINP